MFVEAGTATERASSDRVTPHVTRCDTLSRPGPVERDASDEAGGATSVRSQSAAGLSRARGRRDAAANGPGGAGAGL